MARGGAFHTPVFVVTHLKREPWACPGGTTFHFVNDGIESALQLASSAADGRDVRIGGGGQTISQFLRAGFVDELHIDISGRDIIGSRYSPDAILSKLENISVRNYRFIQRTAVCAPKITQ